MKNAKYKIVLDYDTILIMKNYLYIFIKNTGRIYTKFQLWLSLGGYYECFLFFSP